MEDTNQIPDEINPKFLFSQTSHVLLMRIAKGEIDPKQAAIVELANRGLDQDGRWVGFRKAKAAAGLLVEARS